MNKSIKKAFSLIELLISLIIISCVLASLVPICTKKLMNNRISVSAQKSVDCKKFDTNCSICDKNECKACLNSYELINKQCKKEILKPDLSNCTKVGAVFIDKAYNGVNGKDLCVSKVNAGDIGGPALSSSIDIKIAKNATYRCNSKCCWKGNTAGSCSTNLDSISHGAYPNFNYQACSRTVCNYPATSEICARYHIGGSIKNDNWRLPKQQELLGWKNNLSYINN